MRSHIEYLLSSLSFSPLPVHPTVGLDLRTQLEISQYNPLPPQWSYNKNIVPILNDQPNLGPLDLYLYITIPHQQPWVET
jgi:hypothetical protein